MRTVSKKELQRILEQHALWAGSNKQPGARADLSDTNLTERERS